MLLSTDDERVEEGLRGNIFGMLKPDAGDGGFEGGCGLTADAGMFVIVPLLEDVDIDGGIGGNCDVVGVGVVTWLED